MLHGLASKTNHKFVKTHSAPFWCWDKPRATLDSLDSPRLGLGGSHHLPPYSILCVAPPRTSKATTWEVSPIDVNRSTSSEASSSTFSGPKDAAFASTDNTPSRKSYSSLGKPRSRWAWPPGKPSSLLVRIEAMLNN